MIDGKAAGHTFKAGVCDCGTRLVDLQYLTPEDVGKMNLAHAGSITTYEIAEIKDLVAKMHAQINNSFGWRD